MTNRCIPVRLKNKADCASSVDVLLISSRAGKGFCFPKVRQRGGLLPHRLSAFLLSRQELHFLCWHNASDNLSVVYQGGWEDDETVEAAAMRETVEEAGVRGTLEVSRGLAGACDQHSGLDGCSP